MSKFLSGRQSQLNVGVTSSTESKTVLQVTGKVGIGTTNAGSRSLYVIGDTQTTGVTTLASAGGITTTGGDLFVGGDLYVAENANITGIATIASIAGTGATITNLNVSSGIVTNLLGVAVTFTNGQIVNLTGTAATIANLNVSSGIITNLTGVAATITSITGIAATINRIVSAATSFSQLQVSGISTFTNGPVFIGSGTTTGTADQKLQVTGGAFVSGTVGVGTSNPRETLDVIGTVGVQASGAANRFEIQHNSSLNSLDFIFI
ncbi:MAG: hypothetical protein EBT80_06740 [Chitinophagales bacterium]|nr:hypothetical protein [Chitinophagales bacterium]